MANSTGHWIVGIVVSCLLLTLVCGNTAAQTNDKPLWRIGIGGGVASVLSTASLNELSGVPQPASASLFHGSGSSVRFLPQVFFEYPLFSWGMLGVQAEYFTTPLTLQATEQFPVFIDTAVVDVVNTHSIAATLTTIGVEPFLSIPLFSGLSVRAGSRFDLVLNQSFEQSQEITSPDNVEFVGYEGRVVTASGDIPEYTPLLVSLSLSAGYTFPLNKSNTLQLQPSVFYRQSLSNIVANKEWTMQALGGALAVVYAALPPKRVAIDTVFQRDTTLRLVRGATQEQVVLVESNAQPTVEVLPDMEITTVVVSERYVREIPRPEALLTTGIDIQFVLDSGEHTDTVSGATKGISRVLYVVPSASALYDESSGMLHGVFNREFSKGEERGVCFRASDMQRNLLAHIKQKARSGKCTIAVCCDTASHRIAWNAVHKMRQLCARVWDIPAADIAIDIREEKSQPSSPTTVEVSILPAITAPLIMRDTLAMLPVQQVVFQPSVVSEAGVRHWSLLVLRDSVVLQRFSGEGAVPPTLAWDVQPEEFWGQYPHESIVCVLTVEDRDGHEDTATGSVVIRSSGAERPATVERDILQFVVPEYALAEPVLRSIQQTLRSAGFTAVRATHWVYTGATPKHTIAHFLTQYLGIPQEQIATRTTPQPTTTSLADAYDNLIVITAEPLQR